ncbi:MAG: PIN domain-containing protein [Chloroflexi bacterium]|nr:PIN domain-containing protein [Chloroflexota bacterium]
MTLDNTLAAAVARGTPTPTLYLDANVLLDIVRPQRKQESRLLLDECQQKSWVCSSSYFGLMEALDVEQESIWFRSEIRRGRDVDWLIRRRRDRKLTSQARGRVQGAFYRQFVADVQDAVRWHILDEESWEEAIRLAMETDASAPDCIHLATAKSAACDVLVTSDTQFQNAATGEIETANPEQVLAWLRENT